MSARWAARRVPRAKDGGVPHAQVDLAAYWWDPASPMVCTARWALTSVLFGARVAEISLECPWPLAGSDMSSRASSHWLWCTARLIHRGQTCVMCRWRLASGVATILKAWNRSCHGHRAIATICTGPEPTSAVPRSTSVLISALNVIQHGALVGVARASLHGAVCAMVAVVCALAPGSGGPPL